MGDVYRIGGVVLGNIDFTVAGAEVEYELTVAVGQTACTTALFDDNGNAEESDSPGPDQGHLLSSAGFNPPSVVVHEPGEYDLHLGLNFSFPF